MYEILFSLVLFNLLNNFDIFGQKALVCYNHFLLIPLNEGLYIYSFKISHHCEKVQGVYKALGKTSAGCFAVLDWFIFSFNILLNTEVQ